MPLACLCLSNPESSVPESGLTGLEICFWNAAWALALKTCGDFAPFFSPFLGTQFSLMPSVGKFRYSQRLFISLCIRSKCLYYLTCRKDTDGKLTRNCKPDFQVEGVGGAPLWWSSERAVSGALPVYTGREPGFLIIQICRSNSVIQDYFDIFYEFNRH